MTAEPQPRASLSEQLCRILEETAFMLVDNPEAAMPEPCAVIEAQLPFTGARSGRCWLVVSEADARQLATEMLGETTDEALATSTPENAVSELLNILTAWLLDDWLGGESPHQLGLPTCSHCSLESSRVWSIDEAQRVVVTTDSGCTFVSCVTEE